MIGLRTTLDFQVAHSDLDIARLDSDEDKSYIGYDGKRVHHSCERMMSDWEAGFCSEDLYYVCSVTFLERGSQNYYGYTYACGRHLRAVALAFCVTLEEKSLDRAFDEWTDQENEREKASADLQEQQATAATTEEGA